MTVGGLLGFMYGFGIVLHLITGLGAPLFAPAFFVLPHGFWIGT
jgi:hypothetical protein